MLDENSWIEKTTENSNRLKEYNEARLSIEEDTTDDQVNEWINSAYQSELEDARRQLKKGAEAYIAVGEFDLSGLNSAYGRLDFLAGNKTIRYYINFEDPESVERYKRHKEKVKLEGRDESTKIQGQQTCSVERSRP